MATYVIGDIQGCHDELQRLVATIGFDPETDRLWFTGDLVNRGPRSLEVLRYVRDLGEGAVTVLGNHDLHLLAVALGGARVRRSDTLDAILAAPDCDELLEWLRRRPLLHHDERLGFTLVHAGMPPQWDLDTAVKCAHEVEAVLAGSAVAEFFQHLYGDTPDQWRTDLVGWPRLRFVVNAFTRLRYCDAEGRMALNEKGAPGTQTPELLPWFEVPGRRSQGLRILFGHWSTLGGPSAQRRGILPLDTGCVWGGKLTAVRLDDGALFAVGCAGACTPRAV